MSRRNLPCGCRVPAIVTGPAAISAARRGNKGFNRGLSPQTEIFS